MKKKKITKKGKIIDRKSRNMIGQKLLKIFTFWLIIFFLNPDWLLSKDKLISIIQLFLQTNVKENANINNTDQVVE